MKVSLSVETTARTPGGKKMSETSATTEATEATSTDATTSMRNSSHTFPSPPSHSRQRQDVLRLLLSRKSSLQATIQGEAFFLINWQWWRRWCRQVDLFYCGDEAKSKRILDVFPPGAVFPGTDSDDDSSTSSDDHFRGSEPLMKTRGDGFLGPIDNSSLLLDPKSILHQQWYFSIEGSKKQLLLRPNLVRGFHFEVLPREIYQALRSWYGETTSPICRRVNSRASIVLYEPLRRSARRSHSSTIRCSACRAPNAVARCRQCSSIHYCDRRCQESHWPFHKKLCKQIAKEGIIDGEPSTNDIVGLIGLNNLGNTCFMNSALQCIRHVTPLTRYFLSQRYQEDLNNSNPLGTGGKLAATYAELLKELWMRNTASSVSPTALKRAIALFAPRFAGYLQHDAQEFLAYLLDGLHEDLNRIKKAPYVVFPDVTGEENMAVAGAQAWETHQQRNNSFVLDTAYGQFQSTCICPQCRRTSVSFDAFNHVSLEIPQPLMTTKTIAVLVFRLPTMGADTPSAPPQRHILPYRYAVTVHASCSMADLKLSLGNLTGIPPSNLILAEIYEHSICDVLNDDTRKVSTLGSNDTIAAYESDSWLDEDLHSSRVLYGLVTQFLVVRTKEGKLGRAKFGFPLVAALDLHCSCRDTWNRLWSQVDALVRQPGASHHVDFVDVKNEVLRHDLLAIRVVTNQGRPAPIFSTAEGVPSSLLPHDSDETLSEALQKFQGRFLTIAFEWRNPESDELGPLPIVRPKFFSAFEDHKSVLEMAEHEQTNKHQRNVTLDQCFDRYTKPERLDEKNMWYCSQCKRHVRAMKTMKLWRLPSILIIHLKRFEYKVAIRQEKLETLVEFPVTGLNMAKHCSGPNLPFGNGSNTVVDGIVDAKYDLFGVVNHFGRMGFGHYNAFCSQWDEEGMSGRWHLYDDSKVRLADPSEFSSPAAYILFYRRRQFH